MHIYIYIYIGLVAKCWVFDAGRESDEMENYRKLRWWGNTADAFKCDIFFSSTCI